jgi:hypothetical protein
VDDQAESSERRLALDPGDDVVGQLDVLERPAEAELARVDDERLAVGDVDLLGQVRRRVAQVDRRRPVIVEDAERTAEPEVDASRLDQRRVPRLDPDPAVADQAEDRPVGENG